MTTVELLKAARRRIEDPARWTQRSTAKDADGGGCPSTSGSAVCWCAHGALWAESPAGGYQDASNALHYASRRLGFHSGIDLNDGSNHATVLKMFDLAIADEATDDPPHTHTHRGHHAQLRTRLHSLCPDSHCTDRTAGHSAVGSAIRRRMETRGDRGWFAAHGIRSVGPADSGTVGEVEVGAAVAWGVDWSARRWAVTEPNEVSEAWKDHREAQRARRAVRLPVRTAEIYALISQGKAQGVVKLTEFQFRINGKLDLHPTHRRFHVLATGKRGTYRSAAQVASQVLGKTESKNA